MDLRRELLPRDPVDLTELTAALEDAFTRLDDGAPTGTVADELSSRFGVQLSAGDLHAALESEDVEDLARRLRRAPAHVLRQLNATRDELLELARRFMDPDHVDDSEWYMAVFDANVPHPAGSNLAFYPPAGADPTPEQVTDWALSYRAIEL